MMEKIENCCFVYQLSQARAGYCRKKRPQKQPTRCTSNAGTRVANLEPLMKAIIAVRESEERGDFR